MGFVLMVFACAACGTRAQGLPIPEVVGRLDYFERAYHGCADEEDI
jgi:hypothetical protein